MPNTQRVKFDEPPQQAVKVRRYFTDSRRRQRTFRFVNNPQITIDRSCGREVVVYEVRQ